MVVAKDKEEHLTKKAFERLLTRAAQPIKKSRRTSPKVDQKEDRRGSDD